ncbi:MAG: aminopeptidase [Armatimonadota bacterium]|nr:aminopeptidase [Armatimonadota bacterium]MDR7450856.1 aminopeptidase [Armatimonadota bacterium]MDR7465777.1 aminopeptidase [Armatimonadota bacterium]MDR7493685.1 aminopeptidase [Armatimonadota bacterium]MDR7499066.1 aminopeptidase [Armatimonadota bacterium]
MVDPRIDKLARVLVHYSLKIRPGDLFRISGPALAAPLIVAVYREGLAAGAHPFVRVGLDGLEEIYFKHASEEQLRFVSELQRQETERITASLGIWGEWNTRELTRIDPKRVALRREATRELQQRFLERAAAGELRWCGTQYPTHAEAQDAEMSLAEYEDFVFGAGLLDREDPVAAWEQVRREQDRIVAFLNRRNRLVVRGPDIDLEISVEGRRWINAAGESNFPDGEVFTGPVEDSANGRVRFSFPAIYDGREVEGVELVFERGKVVQARAAKGEEFLKAMLDTDAGARYLGEFAFGTNYHITQFTRNILFDEKIGGTLHMALGAGYPETGSKNVSGLHWDMICDLRTGAEVIADGEVIYRNGRFLI